MGAIKSIITVFARLLDQESFSQFTNFSKITAAFSKALESHIYVVEISTFVDQQSLLLMNKDQIFNDHKTKAIYQLAEKIIDMKAYELTEEISGPSFKNTYKINILIDRGLR